MSRTNKTSTKRARRTQVERRAESGLGLVKAAITVAGRDGVTAATFEAIGREAGYSRSLVTQRFGSKQGLTDAVIAFLHERLESILTDNQVDQMSGLDALMAYMDLFLRNLEPDGELRAYFMLLSSAVAEATPLRAAFAAHHERVRQRMAAFIVAGQEDGCILPEIDADSAALIVGSLQLGLAMQLLVDPTMNLEPVRKTALASVRRSFATPRSERQNKDVS